MRNIAPRDGSELESLEQREWLESLEYVIEQGDRGRVQRLLAALRHHARMAGVSLPFTAVTPYVNSILPEEQVPLPGNQEIERRSSKRVRVRPRTAQHPGPFQHIAHGERGEARH